MTRHKKRWYLRRDGVPQRYTTTYERWKNADNSLTAAQARRIMRERATPPRATAPEPKPPRGAAPEPKPQRRKPGGGGGGLPRGFVPARGATYSTWFKAMGTTGSLGEMRGANSPELVHLELKDYAAPAAFYSAESGLLGQVKWDGVVSLRAITERLNRLLQFRGREDPEFDFREVYDQWEYWYEIIEERAGVQRVVYEDIDSFPRRGRNRVGTTSRGRHL